uniref:Uncharacterized protein n=1 Tax=Cacopsylla melanoneura TaxID=428564 RepID=A0A8D8THT5_9HEMI
MKQSNRLHWTKLASTILSESAPSPARLSPFRVFSMRDSATKLLEAPLRVRMFSRTFIWIRAACSPCIIDIAIVEDFVMISRKFLEKIKILQGFKIFGIFRFQ